MICLVAATPRETTLLRQQLPLTPDPRFPQHAFSCHFCKEDILLLHTGIGIASAAISLTHFLHDQVPELLLVFGCGGSYSASGLQNGDLALATSETYGDLGAEGAEGFIPLSDLGIRQAEGELPLFDQHINLQTDWLQKATLVLQDAAELSAARIVSGPFVTVNTVSGMPELSRNHEQRTSGICENMEGAALAQVAKLYTFPLIELRGISNPCGTRDRAAWDLSAGMKIAQQAVLRLLKEMPRLRSLTCV